MSAKHVLDLITPLTEHNMTTDDAELTILELDRPTIDVSSMAFLCSCSGRCSLGGQFMEVLAA